MKRTKSILRIQSLCWAVLLGLVPAITYASADDHVETRQLIDAVNRNSDVSKTGPYAWTAKVVIDPGSRGERTGELRLYRDQDRTRTEFRLGTYLEIRVRDGKKLYIARSQPMPLWEATAVAFPERFWKIDTPPRAKWSKIDRKKHENVDAQCFSMEEMRGGNYYGIRYCVDAQSKSILERTAIFETLKLSGYSSIEEGRLPTAVIINNKEPVSHIELRDVEVRRLIPNERTFAPPEHAREFETCDHIEGGDVIRNVAPEFQGSGSGSSHRSGATMFIYGIIEKDGSFSNVHVFSPNGEALEKAGKAAAAQWKFTPGTCDGHAVAAERWSFFGFFAR
jgi:hypothetical protein